MSDIQNSISRLKPGQRALIEVELINGSCRDGESEVLCVISRVQKDDQQDYFKIHSVQPIEDNRKYIAGHDGEVIDMTTFGDLWKDKAH